MQKEQQEFGVKTLEQVKAVNVDAKKVIKFKTGKMLEESVNR